MKQPTKAEMMAYKRRERAKTKAKVKSGMKELLWPGIYLLGASVVLYMVWQHVPAGLTTSWMFVLILLAGLAVSTAGLIFLNAVFSSTLSPLMKPMIGEIDKHQDDKFELLLPDVMLAVASSLIGLGNRLLFGLLFATTVGGGVLLYIKL